MNKTVKGRLIVAGTGMQLNQITISTKAYIEQAEKVLYLVADPVTEKWIKGKNESAESLQDCYAEGKERLESYKEMVSIILNYVREGKHVCALFYGHPGVFVNPSHEVIKQAKGEGFEAIMLPGISAEDCLFSDIGIDPSVTGCQSFEATDFLLYNRKFDPRSKLILWQVGVIGNLNFNTGIQKNTGVSILCNLLKNYYPSEHEVIIYEAAQYAICAPKMKTIKLENLVDELLTPISTLYIPEFGISLPDKDIANQLGITIRTVSTEQS